MLARFRKKIDEKEEGFTLIELLVVIIIIGILAAIAIPVFLSQKTKGYEASMKSDLRTAASEVESANVDNQDYGATKFASATVAPAPGTTAITGANQIVGTATTTINLSPGNSIVWMSGSTTAFCLKATHTGATDWYYSSAKGGINKTGC